MVHIWLQSDGDLPLTASGKIRKAPASVVAGWVSSAWEKINPEIIRCSFMRCCISNNLDAVLKTTIFGIIVMLMMTRLMIVMMWYIRRREWKWCWWSHRRRRTVICFNVITTRILFLTLRVIYSRDKKNSKFTSSNLAWCVLQYIRISLRVRVIEKKTRVSIVMFWNFHNYVIDKGLCQIFIQNWFIFPSEWLDIIH